MYTTIEEVTISKIKPNELMSPITGIYQPVVTERIINCNKSNLRPSSSQSLLQTKQEIPILKENLIKPRSFSICSCSTSKDNKNLSITNINNNSNVQLKPSLYDILHHCNIYSIKLDPFISNETELFGLTLAFTKFPLNDLENNSKSNDNQTNLDNENQLNLNIVTVIDIDLKFITKFGELLRKGDYIIEINGINLLNSNDLGKNRLDLVCDLIKDAQIQAIKTNNQNPIRITAARLYSNCESKLSNNTNEQIKDKVKFNIPIKINQSNIKPIRFKESYEQTKTNIIKQSFQPNFDNGSLVNLF